MIRKRKHTLAGIGALIVAAVAFVAAPGLADLGSQIVAPPTTTQAPAAPEVGGPLTASAADALEQLAGIPIEATESIDYDEDVYGQRWADIDRNGCDTRNDMLRRDLTNVQLKPNTNGCVVLTGTLLDSYTGETVAFERKSEGYQPVQIDHVYPRALAAAHGALELSDEQRLQFANDPLNLVTTIQNQVKGDSGPAEFMPAGTYGCDYSIRFIAVAAKYSLSLAPADHDALSRTLSTCTDEGVDGTPVAP